MLFRKQICAQKQVYYNTFDIIYLYILYLYTYSYYYIVIMTFDHDQRVTFKNRT